MIHPSHFTTSRAILGHLFNGFPFTLRLPRAELVEHLLHRPQHSNLALGVLHFKLGEPGFDLVQTLPAGIVLRRWHAL